MGLRPTKGDESLVGRALGLRRPLRPPSANLTFNGVSMGLRPTKGDEDGVGKVGQTIAFCGLPSCPDPTAPRGIFNGVFMGLRPTKGDENGREWR